MVSDVVQLQDSRVVDWNPAVSEAKTPHCTETPAEWRGLKCLRSVGLFKKKSCTELTPGFSEWQEVKNIPNIKPNRVLNAGRRAMAGVFSAAAAATDV